MTLSGPFSPRYCAAASAKLDNAREPSLKTPSRQLTRAASAPCLAATKAESCRSIARPAPASVPPTTMQVRLATVGPLSGTMEVSGLTTSTAPIGTPRASATICAKW